MEQVWCRGSKEERSCDLEERVAWAAEHEGGVAGDGVVLGDGEEGGEGC